MLEHALSLAEQGYAVFPVIPGTRTPPAGTHGHLDATNDPGEVKDLWAGREDCIPGICPGKSEPPLVVVDIDIKKGAKGAASARALREAGLLPPTFTVQTPSGGAHLYYRSDGSKISNSASSVAAGIDIRGTEGWVVGVGTPGYTPINSSPAIPAPESLLERVRRNRIETTDTQEIIQDGTDTEYARGIEYLQQLRADGSLPISGHGRNNLTYRVGSVLRDFGLSPGQCIRAIRESGWGETCDAHWFDSKLPTVIKNVFRYNSGPGKRFAVDPAATAELADVATNHNPFRPRFDDEVEAAPDPQWLIAGTFATGSISVIYGQPGSYKSFIALDVAARLSLGADWADRATEACPAVYVSGEGQAGYKKRFLAVKEALGVPKLPHLAFVQQVPAFPLPDDIDSFVGAVEHLEPGLVVIDTLAWAMAGLKENVAEDATQFMRSAKDLIARLDCAILFVHHSGKDDKRGLRGSSALNAAVDTVLRVERTADLHVAVTMEKQKDAEQWPMGQGFELVKSETVDSLYPKAEDARVVEPPDRMHETNRIARDGYLKEVMDTYAANGVTDYQPSSVVSAEMARVSGRPDDPATDRIMRDHLSLYKDGRPGVVKYLRVPSPGRGAPSYWQVPPAAGGL